MLAWIRENVTLLQLAVSMISAVVWIFYLQIFLLSFLRQRRPEILISRGAGVGMEARCFIANLGFEPIYVSQLLISIQTPEGKRDAAITDREVMTEEQQRDPRQATNQGPLKSGDSFDAGSFTDLLRQALRAAGAAEDVKVESFNITVVGIHAASAAFVGATRHFDVIDRNGWSEIQPDDLATRQIRSFLGRRRLRRKLQRDLSWYRS